MNFGEAFEEVKKGKVMRLPHWKKGVVIEVQNPSVGSNIYVEEVLDGK